MESHTDISTEQAILEAAERLFLEKGFALTSTTEIARVAGCNQAMVHYYYRTKEKLFTSVFEKKARMMVANLLQADRPDLSFEEKLRHKIEAHYNMLKENPRLPFLFFNEMITNPPRLLALREIIKDFPLGIVKPMEAELKAEIARGNIRPVSMIDLLMTMLSLNVFLFLASPIFKTLTGISDEEFEQMVERRREENVTIILRSLRPY
ncbi:MAG: hypothetical protein A2X22_14140 [Bacteroidetes bacterium GWF2_49_14]|nr:MAG: hypothetical protein A2X22_14140 [Bacteroidetes bacterium GWF2_49_14]HBB91207.1 TetR/AcrR family transcriptional regulator [Bacteroidales bacterium]